MKHMDDAVDEAVGLLVLLFTVVIFVYLGVLLLLGVKLFRYLWSKEGQGETEAPPAPTRMFGAHASERWLMAYDYWLYQLEQATRIEFSTSPTRLMAGSLIVTVGPTLTVGALLTLILPSVGILLTLLLCTLAFCVALMTGLQMARPASGWFDSSIGMASEPESGIILGEETW